MKNTILITAIFIFVSTSLLKSQESNNIFVEAYDLILSSKNITDRDSTLNIIYKVENLIREKSTPDTLLALLHHRKGQILAEQYKIKNADSLYQLAEIVYRDKKMEQKLVSILNSRGIAIEMLGEYDKANILFDEALNIAKKNDNKFGYGQILYSLGHHYDVRGDYEKSVEYSVMAAETFKKLGKLKHYFMSKTLLSTSLGHISSNRQLLMLQDLLKEPKLDSFPNVKLTILSNIGVCYGKKNIPDTSLIFLNRALVIAKKLNVKKSEIDLYGSIANAHLVNGDFNKAIDYYKKEKLLLPKTSKFSIAINHLNMGMAYTNLNKVKNAIFNLEKAKNHAKYLENPNFNQFVIKQLAYAHAKANNYKDAFNLYKTASIQKDSIFTINKAKQIQEMEVKFKTAEKQAENDKLIAQQKLEKAKLKTQKLLTTLGGLGILLLSSLLFIIFRQKKKQKDLNKTLADRNVKISLISREIAHRAKNQLALATNLISNQKYKAEDLGAKQLIEESENKLKALSAVNRRLSDDDELSKVNLKEVIEEVVSNNIYSLSSMDIKYNLSLPNTKIDSNKMSLIALIINELTTNSIKHAFEGSNDPRISVEASITNKKFSMKYTDNGNTMKQESSKGRGKNLINGLVTQLQGIYKIDVTSGFNFDLNMPI